MNANFKLKIMGKTIKFNIDKRIGEKINLKEQGLIQAGDELFLICDNRVYSAFTGLLTNVIRESINEKTITVCYGKIYAITEDKKSVYELISGEKVYESDVDLISRIYSCNTGLYIFYSYDNDSFVRVYSLSEDKRWSVSFSRDINSVTPVFDYEHKFFYHNTSIYYLSDRIVETDFDNDFGDNLRKPKDNHFIINQYDAELKIVDCIKGEEVFCLKNAVMKSQFISSNQGPMLFSESFLYCVDSGKVISRLEGFSKFDEICEFKEFIFGITDTNYLVELRSGVEVLFRKIGMKVERIFAIKSKIYIVSDGHMYECSID